MVKNVAQFREKWCVREGMVTISTGLKLTDFFSMFLFFYGFQIKVF